MRNLKNIGLLAIDSSRTRAYLSALKNHSLKLEESILLTSSKTSHTAFPTVSYFDNTTSAQNHLEQMQVPTTRLETNDINAECVLKHIQNSDVNVWIYSGPGGAILGQALFETGKNFLHIHPGIVPQFRGSTTIYYSLLENDTCGASAMFLDENIDTGPVLAQQTYAPPQDRATLDYGYDPYIRSELLITTLQEYIATGTFNAQKQTDQTGETYYIMHPVLRHIAILSQRTSDQPGNH